MRKRFCVLWALEIYLAIFQVNSNASSEPVNEIPMYGGARKTPEQEKADKDFTDSVTKNGTTKEQASKLLTDRGWEAFYNNDLSTAIKRFNQAWLLTPKETRVLWGF